MAVEREIKLPVPDAAEARRSLESRGWRAAGETAFEDNIVYDTLDGALYASGRLLRARETAGGGVLTVKLPIEGSGPHKTRREHEIKTSDAAALRAILEALGYVRAWRYQKRRTTFRRGAEPGVVELDETPIGSFLELEGPAEWIDRTASELGFSAADYVVETYGDLFRRRRAALGPGAPADMLLESD